MREVIGVRVAESESRQNWQSWQRLLRADTVRPRWKLVISNAHLALKAAIQSRFLGASWQRCRVHIMRGALKWSAVYPYLHETKMTPPRLRSKMSSCPLSDLLTALDGT